MKRAKPIIEEYELFDGLKAFVTYREVFRTYGGVVTLHITAELRLPTHKQLSTLHPSLVDETAVFGQPLTELWGQYSGRTRSIRKCFSSGSKTTTVRELFDLARSYVQKGIEKIRKVQNNRDVKRANKERLIQQLRADSPFEYEETDES